MITKNFRLNALANKYASALYNHITSTSGGDYFMVDADGEAVLWGGDRFCTVKNLGKNAGKADE
ncbi:hypothetical protein ACM2UU_15570 [Escherichia coli]